jgi:flagellar biosynthetic protein FlhB
MAMFKTIIYVACLMVIVAVLDFFYQKFNFERDSKMSKQEIKDEHKNREGDPNVKARIRTLQRRAATNRMMQDVPNAQAIITNPTHIAIAIQYNKDMGAPKVIAKGADFIAEKIRKIAKENDIPLVENKPLARILYKTVKVGQYIPENLYNAVAEVLAYVMKIKNKMASTLLGEDNVNSDMNL